MKTRKNTQTALAQPESSWSRKRSERIVIRIQIQITKKKIASDGEQGLTEPEVGDQEQRGSPFMGVSAMR